MTRHVAAFTASLFVASALVLARQDPAPIPQNPPDPAREIPAAKAPAPKDVSVTGCLIQGSSPTVFLLDNAKYSESDKAEPAKTFLLASGAEDVAFKSHLNHEVTISGTADAKQAPVPAPGQKVNEKDLPKFTATRVLMLSDKCTAPRP
jgi:hypothetical protein